MIINEHAVDKYLKTCWIWREREEEAKENWRFVDSIDWPSYLKDGDEWEDWDDFINRVQHEFWVNKTMPEACHGFLCNYLSGCLRDFLKEKYDDFSFDVEEIVTYYVKRRAK